MTPGDTDNLADLIASAVMRSVTRSLRKASVHVPHAPAGTRSSGATPEGGHWVTIHGHATYIDNDGKFHFHGKDSPAADPKGRGFHQAVATALSAPAHGPAHPRVRSGLATASDPLPGPHGFTRTRHPREHQLTRHDALSGPGAPAVDSRYTGRGFVTTAGSDADPQTGAIGVVSSPSEVFPDATRDQANQRAQALLVAGHARVLAQYAAHHQATIAGNADQSTDASTTAWQAGHDAAHPLDPLPPGNMPAAVSRRAAAAAAPANALPPPAPSAVARSAVAQAPQSAPAPVNAPAPPVVVQPRASGAPPPAPSSVASARRHSIGDPDPTTREAAERAAETHSNQHDYHRAEKWRLLGLASVLERQVQQGSLVEGSQAFMDAAEGHEYCAGLTDLAGEHDWDADTHEAESMRLSDLSATLPSEHAPAPAPSPVAPAPVIPATASATPRVPFDGTGLDFRPGAGRVLPDDLRGARLEGAYLHGVDLSGRDISGANLAGADLRGANLSDANLTGANLSGSNRRGAHRFGANLFRANLTGANLAGANLSGAHLESAVLSGANLADANLQRANVSHANLSRADLPRANFSGADLTGASLFRADLCGTNFTAASMRSTNLTEALLRDADLSGASMLLADLTNADLSGAGMTGADLILANLTGATCLDASGQTVPFTLASIGSMPSRPAAPSGTATPATSATVNAPAPTAPATPEASLSMPVSAGPGAQPNAPSFPLPTAAPSPAPQPIGDTPDWSTVFPRHLTRDTMLGGRRLGDWSDSHGEGTYLRGDAVPGGSSFRHQGVPLAPGRSILRFAGPDVTTTSRFTETPQDGPGSAGKIAPYTISVHDGRTGAHLSEYHSGASRTADEVAFRTRQVANWAWHNANANRDIATST